MIPQGTHKPHTQKSKNLRKPTMTMWKLKAKLIDQQIILILIKKLT